MALIFLGLLVLALGWIKGKSYLVTQK